MGIMKIMKIVRIRWSLASLLLVGLFEVFIILDVIQVILCSRYPFHVHLLSEGPRRIRSE